MENIGPDCRSWKAGSGVVDSLIGRGEWSFAYFPWVFRVVRCLFFRIFQGEIFLPNLDSRVFHLRIWFQIVFTDQIDGRDVRCRDPGERCQGELRRLEVPDQDPVACPLALSFTTDRNAANEGWYCLGPVDFGEEFLFH